MELTHFSLFTGIGGIDLAAEWAGFKTVGQCEWADYPTKVLEKHWPDVPRWRNIRDVNAKSVYDRGIGAIDIISGGFPCQPFSVAGKQKGKEDNRYLWPEMLRVIRELTPTWVLGENVPGILSIAADDVCKDLEREGYEVVILNFEAAAVGAKHRRERVFFMGHSKYNGQPTMQKLRSYEATGNKWWEEEQKKTRKFEGASKPINVSGICRSKNGSKQYSHVSDTKNRDEGLPSRKTETVTEFREFCEDVANTDNTGFSSQRLTTRVREEKRETCSSIKRGSMLGTEWNTNWWTIEPSVGRVANGIPNRVDRIRCLGNAVVPQQIYPILQAIADIENQH